MKKSSFKVFSLIAAIALCLPALASQNIISSVIISNSKDKPNGYELNIDSTASSQYKTHVEEDGSVYFDLKNASLAQNAGTVYDDVTNIDNVTVRQLNKNNVRIYVKGKNAANTDIVFLNSLYEQPAPTKKVVINRPQSEYQPTNPADLENQDDIQDWDDNSFNFSHLLTSIMAGLKEGPSGIVLMILAAFALMAVVIKSIGSRLSYDKEPLIGLNQNFNKEKIEMSSRRQDAMRQAQEELTRAHQKYQDYLNNKYKNAAPAFNAQTQTDAIKKSIAINQYQKSTKNPYLDQEVIRIKKDLTAPNNRLDAQREIPRENFSIPPRPRMAQTQTIQRPQVQQLRTQNTTSPYIQRRNNRLETIAAQKPTLKSENFRFLESVSKIYENSGRKDLAMELKNSMMKAKQSI